MTDAGRVLIRPRRALIASGFSAGVLVMVPVFGVLYWLTVPNGPWALVLVGHAVSIVAGLGAMLRQLSVYTAVSGGELHGRGIISPIIRVPLERIAQVDLVETYVGQAPETVTQLLVRDIDGRCLFRMRSDFWHADDVADLVAALPARPRVVDTPMTLHEFFQEYPGSAYWFENRPTLCTSLLVASVAAFAAVLFWIMTSAGIPATMVAK